MYVCIYVCTNVRVHACMYVLMLLIYVATDVDSAALMRQAVRAATFHANHRSAFKNRLINKPAMRVVLADIGLESEAAVLMVRMMLSVHWYCAYA